MKPGRNGCIPGEQRAVRLQIPEQQAENNCANQYHQRAHIRSPRQNASRCRLPVRASGRWVIHCFVRHVFLLQLDLTLAIYRMGQLVTVCELPAVGQAATDRLRP